MYEPLEENLIDEVTRLVGRPHPVVREAISCTLNVMVNELNPDETVSLSPFPLTAWQAIAPQHGPSGAIWSAALSAGLTTEEVFTTLAILDDYVRRRFGNEAWNSVAKWGPRLARQYEFDFASRSSGSWPGAETGLGATV